MWTGLLLRPCRGGASQEWYLGYLHGRSPVGSEGPGHETPWQAAQARSNLSRFMTLPQAVAKSETNFSCESLQA